MSILKEFETPELDKIKLPNWMTTVNYKPLQLIELSSLIENEVWITANKTKIYVKNMSNSHINNCINCLNGKGKSIIPNGYLGGKEKWLKIFNKELLNRQ